MILFDLTAIIMVSAVAKVFRRNSSMITVMCIHPSLVLLKVMSDTQTWVFLYTLKPRSNILGAIETVFAVHGAHITFEQIIMQKNRHRTLDETKNNRV